VNDVVDVADVNVVVDVDVKQQPSKGGKKLHITV